MAGGALREILAKFGFEVDSSKLEQANAQVDKTKEKIGTLGTVIAGGLIYHGIKSFIDGMRETAHELHATSVKLGISVEDWQKWKFAAELAGVSGEELATGFKFLAKNLEEAATKGKDQAALFKKLGVTIKDSSGEVRSGTEVMEETGLAIAAMKNPTERTAATLKVFGRSGLALLPFFDKGKDGVHDLLKEIDKLGGGLSKKAIERLAESARASKKFDMALESLKSRIAEKAIPWLTSLVEQSLPLVVAFGDVLDKTSLLETGLGILGVAAGLVIVPFLPLIAAFTAFYLVAEDLFTAFRGGKSVIGAVVDKLGGNSAWLKAPSGDDWKLFFHLIGADLDDFQKRTEGMSFFGKVGEAAKLAFSVIGGAISDGFSSANNAVKDWTDAHIVFPLQGMAARAVAAVTNVGGSIVDGLVEGMKAAWHKVEEFWDVSGGALIRKVKDVFGSHSPATKLVPEGVNIPAGFAVGMKQGLPKIAAQAEAMRGAATPDRSPDVNAPRVSSSSSSSSRVYNVSHRSEINQEFHGIGSHQEAGDTMRSSMAGHSYDERRAMIEELETLGEPA